MNGMQSVSLSEYDESNGLASHANGPPYVGVDNLNKKKNIIICNLKIKVIYLIIEIRHLYIF